MSSYGFGQGLAQGVQMLAPMVMNKMRMDQQDTQFNKAMDADLEWKRGLAGLGPSYEEAEKQSQPAPMGGIPSTANMDQPSQVGRLAVPGQAMPMAQPRSAAPRPMGPPAGGQAGGLTPAELLAATRSPMTSQSFRRPRMRF